jgi:hypothetical protein
MSVLVSTDGRYHGEVESPEAARRLAHVQQAHTEGFFRLVSLENWAAIAKEPDRRAELCQELGTVI